MEQTQTVVPQTPTTRPDTLGHLLFVLAVLALALAPTQLAFHLKGIPLHPAEPVLALAALVWAIRWLRVRDTGSLPPLAHWLVVGAAALGVFALGDRLQLSVAKEVAQTLLYLIVAVTIFRAVFTTPQRLRVALLALLATTTLAVALGVAQRVRLQQQYQPDPARRIVFTEFTPRAYLTAEIPVHVASTFGMWDDHGYHPSRTAYAGFLALVLPFALALLVTERRKAGLVVWFGLLFAGAAVSVLAGYVLPALLLGLLVTGVALGPRVGRNVLVGILLYLAVMALVPFQRVELLREPFRLTVSRADAARLYEGTPHLKKFWGEQQAALNMLRNRPLFGVGAGKYQGRVNQAYDLLSPITSQRLEPDAQNGYLLTAAGTGLVGLAALLTLLGAYLGGARRLVRQSTRNPWAAALLGAMVALCLLLFVTYPWVRGTSIVVAAMLAAIANGATGALLPRSEE